MVGDVHRTALAAAVALLLAEQLAEHPLDGRALRQAVAVSAVRARDEVVAPERLADADGDSLLADVEVRETWHLGRAVELVDPLFEGTDALHLLVHAERKVGSDQWRRHCRGRHQRSTFLPASAASTS